MSVVPLGTRKNNIRPNFRIPPARHPASPPARRSNGGKNSVRNKAGSGESRHPDISDIRTLRFKTKFVSGNTFFFHLPYIRRSEPIRKEAGRSSSVNKHQFSEIWTVIFAAFAALAPHSKKPHPSALPQSRDRPSRHARIEFPRALSASERCVAPPKVL